MKRFSVLPSTQLGWLGLAATVIFVVLIGLKMNPGIPVPSFAIFGIGFGAIAVNITAWVRKERSIVLFIVGGLIGFATIVWTIGELAFPH